MGKPVHERPGYESREDFEQALSDFFKGYLDHEAIIEALRIAAEQVGEREKVVAWLDALSQEAKQKRSVDRRAFLEGLAIMIQRGDHSSATPVSAPDDRWPEAPRDDDWYRADEVRKSVDCWIYRGGEDHVVNTYARAFAALRAEIERGDHSSAKPAGEGR